MKRHHDPDCDVVSDFVAKYQGDPARLEKELRRYKRGSLWKKMLRQYFPQLRAVHLMIVRNTKPKQDEAEKATPVAVESQTGSGNSANAGYIVSEDSVADAGISEELIHRMPLLSVRTNLLYDMFYMPNYGFAPMWNVSLEYYPRTGHFTYGASFISPFWRKAEVYKFFQFRNYELEARYYLKATSNADYRGLYIGAAIDANKFAIGLSKTKGWQGIGFGGQATIGYVAPISRDHAWKLHFTLGVGYYQTNYDPYVYGKPKYFGGEEDGLYYFETDKYTKDFRPRRHLYRWIGPTQLGISISYDLLWRRGTDRKNPSYRGKDKGISLHHYEK